MAASTFFVDFVIVIDNIVGWVCKAAMDVEIYMLGEISR